MVRFSASQSVTISVPPQPVSIEAYLSQPDRLVYALMDKRQVDTVNPNLFRVKIRPIRFIGLSLQPVCDIEVWLEDTTVRLRSDRCQLEGRESINQRFSVNMQGYLVPQTTSEGKRLRGQANLKVSVDLPQTMRLTPKTLIERTGNSIINGILMTLKQRLMRQLIRDYCAWASSHSSSQVTSLS